MQRGTTIPQPVLMPETDLAGLRHAIHAVNAAWESACVWLDGADGHPSPLSERLREMKDCLQVRLLQRYPHDVRLVHDQDVPGRPVYSIQVPGMKSDAAHCPVNLVARWAPILPTEVVAQHHQEEA